MRVVTPTRRRAARRRCASHSGAARAQVDAVERAVDRQGSGQTARPAREVAQGARAAALLHQRDAVVRHERAQQHAGAHAARISALTFTAYQQP